MVTPAAPDSVIRVRIRACDGLGRSTEIKGRGGVLVEDGRLVLVPSNLVHWTEVAIPSDEIFDLRAVGREVCFERRAAGASRYYFLRPGSGSADVSPILNRLPHALRRPRCRSCSARVAADDVCTSCGTSFGKGFRRKAGVMIAGGLCASVLAVLVGGLILRLFGEGREPKDVLHSGLVIAGLAGLATAMIGLAFAVVGPRIRLHYLSYWCSILIVAFGFAAIIGLLIGTGCVMRALRKKKPRDPLAGSAVRERVIASPGTPFDVRYDKSCSEFCGGSAFPSHIPLGEGK